MKHIAVLTSGGDAPGMNAAIRAVAREALARGLTVSGIQHGYAGLLNNQICPLDARAVGGIIHKGGTVLGSARSPEFRTEEGITQGIKNLTDAGIDGLVVIGGNGSQTGASKLFERGIPVVGVASTIDNDLCGTDITIGADTALNIALEAIDRLRVTASSHRRAFLLEVMGRDCGYLALMTGLAGGAEIVVIPEKQTTPDEVAAALTEAFVRGKTHALAVVAEGAEYNAAVLSSFFRENRSKLGLEVRTTTLGHVQRGGTPGAFDRILATRLGASAVDNLLAGNAGHLVGWVGSGIKLSPYSEIAGKTKAPDIKLLDLISRLAL